MRTKERWLSLSSCLSEVGLSLFNLQDNLDSWLESLTYAGQETEPLFKEIKVALDAIDAVLNAQTFEELPKDTIGVNTTVTITETTDTEFESRRDILFNARNYITEILCCIEHYTPGEKEIIASLREMKWLLNEVKIPNVK